MGISIGRAAFAGFGLIRREPLSMLVWGVFYLVVLGLPSFLIMAWIAPDYIAFITALKDNAGSASNPAAMLNMSRKFSLVSLITPLSLVARAVLTTAIMRAVLTPDQKGFFYMKFGMAEVMQGLLSFAMGALMFAGIVVVELVSFIFIGIAAAFHSPIAIGVCVLLIFVAFVAMIWVALRLSLAAPLTFNDKTFRLFESWKLTKGHAGSLFLMSLLMMVVVWLCEVVLLVIMIGIGAAFWYGSGMSGESVTAFFSQPPEVWLRAATPAFAAIVMFSSLLTGAGYAIVMAPFAEAYRELMPKKEDAFV